MARKTQLVYAYVAPSLQDGIWLSIVRQQPQTYADPSKYRWHL